MDRGKQTMGVSAPDVPPSLAADRRIVMTLDAGGTSLRFDAIRGADLLAPCVLPTDPDHLDVCLARIVEGFERVRASLPEPPAAISFGFPGPADYPRGIVEALPNFPAFRGGVALGPMLEDRFGLPVFVNNDASLFAFGEAIAGFLPYVNRLVAEAGGDRCYRHLFGVTLGTGFGGGFVVDGRLLSGDNSTAGEAWLLRNIDDVEQPVEDAASIRAVRRVYAEQTGLPRASVPEPRAIHAIGLGRAPGDPQAAREAFRRLGRAAGDAMAQALTLFDGLAVIGGGMAEAQELFMPALLEALNDEFHRADGPQRRLIPHAFAIDDPGQRRLFLHGDVRSISVPGSSRTVTYDALPRIAVGISRLGTSRAVAIGAYAFALERLDG